MGLVGGFGFCCWFVLSRFDCLRDFLLHVITICLVIVCFGCLCGCWCCLVVLVFDDLLVVFLVLGFVEWGWIGWLVCLL